MASYAPMYGRGVSISTVHTGHTRAGTRFGCGKRNAVRVGFMPGASRADDPAGLDWATAILVAGCAFEAYEGLDGDDVHLSRVTPNGTRVSYLDPSFVESSFDGVVKVEIASASISLPEKPWWNPFSLDALIADPYVMATVDGATSRTDTKWTDASPVFDTQMLFFVKEKGSGRLLLRLMDDNVTASDGELGKAFIPVASLEEGRRQSFELAMGSSMVRCAATYVSLVDNERVMDLVLAEEDVSREVQGSIQRLFASSAGVLESQWRSMHGHRSFVPVAFIENEESDTQVWIFWDRAKRTAVVSYRGTEQTAYKDLISDLNLIPTNVAYDEGRLFKSDSTTDQDDAWVHRGFLEAFLSVTAEVREVVVQQIGGKEPGKWTVITTGHSLGGALSTLSAFELASKSNESGVFAEVKNVTFGSPRVGNKAFAGAFDELVPTCYRFANAKDAVASVPRLLGFTHVGSRVTLLEDEVRVHDREDVQESLKSDELLRKLAAAKLKELTGDQSGSDSDLEEIDEVLEAEREALLALLEGDAVDEHMEDVYFMRLKNMLDARNIY